MLQVKKVRDLLYAMETDGMYYNYISPQTGRFFGDDMSIGMLASNHHLWKLWRMPKRDQIMKMAVLSIHLGSSLGAMGDSFYELLLKSWLVSGRTDKQAYKMYKEASYVVQKQ